jgi:hypothetical protein
VNLKMRQDLAAVEIDGETVVYDPREDGLYHLNPSATIVFKLCDGSGTPEDLAVDIADVGGMPLEEVREQVGHLAHRFEDLGILEGSVPVWDREPEREEPKPLEASDERPKLEDEKTENH